MLSVMVVVVVMMPMMAVGCDGNGGGDTTDTDAKREAKSLEVLFKKTKALPSIYWMPKAQASSSSSS